jgi:LAS superfamily LD-carboxypeptidase LdcB
MADVVESVIYKMGLQGAESFVAGGRILDAFARSSDTATISVSKLEKAQRVSEERWAKIVGRVEPAVRAMIQWGNATKILNDYQQHGIGTAAEYAAVTGDMLNKLLKGSGVAENLGLSFEGLNAQFASGIPSVETLDAALEKLSEDINKYVVDTNVAKAATAVLAESFNLAKEAAQALAAEERNAVTRAGTRTDIGAIQFRDVSTEPVPLAGKHTALPTSEIEQARSDQNARNRQLDYEDRLGVPTATASAFQDLADLEDEVARMAAKARQEERTLRSEFDEAGSSAVKMAEELARLNRARELGININGGYEAREEAIRAKYGQTTEAAERAAAAERLLHDQRRNAITRAGASTREPYRASADEFATNAQGAINERLGVTRPAASAGGAPIATNSALKDAADEQERLTEATEKYLRLIDPTREATERYNTALVELQELELKSELSPLNRAIAEDKLTAAYEKQIHVLSGKAEVERKAAAAKKQTKADAQSGEDAQEKLAASAQTFREHLDPVIGLERRYKEVLQEVETLEKTHNLTSTEATTINQRLAKEYAALSAQAKSGGAAHLALERGMLGATQQSRAMQFAVTNLGFQINDVFTSLASGGHSGADLFRVFAQQAGQFVQAFTQGGGVKNVLSEFGATLLRLATPMNLFLTATAGLGVGLLLLVARSSATESRLRSFDVTLKGLGTRNQASAAGLDAVVKGLRDTGTAADDAFKAVTQFSRVPGINPATAAKLVPLARDISAVTGGDLASIGGQMAEAFSKGTAEAIKFAQAVGGPNSLTAKEIENMQTMARHGDRAGALRIEIAALQRQFGGSFQDSLSDSAKAMNSIGAAWSNMLDELSKTTVVQGAKSAIIGMLNGIAGAVNTAQPAKKSYTAVELANSARYAMGQPPMNAEETAKVEAQYRGQNNVTGGALKGNTYQIGNIAGLNSSIADPLQRLIADAAEKGITLGIGSGFRSTESQSQLYAADLAKHGGRPSGMVAAPGHSQHERGEAADLVDETGRTVRSGTAADAYLRENAAYFGLRRPMSYEPWHVERNRMAAETTYGSGVLANAKPQAQPLEVPTGLNEAQKSLLQDQKEYDAELLKSNTLVGEAKVRQTAYFQALGAGTTDTDKVAMAQQAATQAVAMWKAEIQKAADTQKIANDLALVEARAYGTDVVAGYQAAAKAAGELAVREGTAVDARAKAQELLATQAVQAIRAGREAVAAALPQIANEQKLLEASRLGYEAAQDQQIANAAAEKTQDAVNRAKTVGITLLKDEADKLYAAALAQEKLTAAQKASLQAREFVNQGKLTLQSTALETSLTVQGLPQEQITRQLDYLQAVQTLNTTLRKALPEDRDAYRDIAVSIADAKYQLTQVQREQQKWNDLVLSLASSIQNELTSAIENAFSGEKVESWGKRVQKWIGTAASGLSSSLFLKPALGTVAGALGFGTAAQSLGTFSSLTGSGGLLGSSSSSTSGATIAKNEDGTFSLSNISSTASLGKSLGLFGSEGGSGFLSNTSLGGLFDTRVIDEAAGDFAGSVGALNTTLGGFLGGAGAGLGAGLTINSLLGGNKLGGTVGSGVGSLAGSAIGSIIPGVGTLIGGLVGGSLGGAGGGLFGQTHKRANATGVSIDLSSGKASDFTSSGSAENDRTLKEIRNDLSKFTKDVQVTTGGTASGYINPQATDQGIKLDYAITGFGSGTYDTQDSQDAIDVAEQAIIKGLTGVSDLTQMVIDKYSGDIDDLKTALDAAADYKDTTVTSTISTVIDKTTDPSKLADALKFAETYDKINDAAKDLFASIPADLDISGPFEKARDDIKDTFDEISDSATEFGLSLEPVTAALDEASKRLTKDFNRNIDDLLEAATDPLQSLVDIEKRAGDARVKEAEAVAGDIEAVNKLNAANLDKIWKDQTASIKDLRDEFVTGDLSGLTAYQRLPAAMDKYTKTMKEVQGGDKSKLDQLVTDAKDLFSLSTDSYGQGPITAKWRTYITAVLDNELASRSFAEGTRSTPPGMILVGERGPELISQPGGLQVYTHRETEEILNSTAETAGVVCPVDTMAPALNVLDSSFSMGVSGAGRAFAEGTASASVKKMNGDWAGALMSPSPSVGRAYAAGTQSTPAGVILVGERGSELIGQPGALSVYIHREAEKLLSGMQGTGGYAVPHEDLSARRPDVTSLTFGKEGMGAPKAFAEGTRSTPPGMILVGERGPELISQPGGLYVYTHRETERLLSAMQGPGGYAGGRKDLSTKQPNMTSLTMGDAGMAITRAFADGTTGQSWSGSDTLLDFTAPVVTDQSPLNTNNNSEIVDLLRDVLSAVTVNNTISRIGHQETGEELRAQTDEMRKPAPYEPTRRRV